MMELSLDQLLKEYPFVSAYFKQNRLNIAGFGDKTFRDYLEHFTEEELEDQAIDKEKLLSNLPVYLEQMSAFLGLEKSNRVLSMTILAGNDKSGNPEGFTELTVETSQIISIVGPTGSGKSRLLADIEWAAQKDTPTGRSILINGKKPDNKWRFSSNNRLVAQLSQNMNFVMDLPVIDFLRLHGESRMIQSLDTVIEKIFDAANDLAGERFSRQTPLTELSGGQSRALMIADTAFLSASPIVLIDEIENAGVDRKKALWLLAQEQKIVLMSTHDPILALMGDKRIIIENGGMKAVLETSDMEKRNLRELEDMDRKTTRLLQMLRGGQRVETSVSML